MKQLSLLLCLCLAWAGVKAQPGNGHTSPQLQNSVVVFEAERGVTFSLFVDGDLCNPTPQNRVELTLNDRQYHEYVVVTKRPTTKAAVVTFATIDPVATVYVRIDNKSHKLLLHCNFPLQTTTPKPPHHNQPQPPHTPSTGNNMSERDFNTLLGAFKAESFDNKRLDKARATLPYSRFSAAQIGLLARTFSYDNNKLEFCKLAFNSCTDKQNFYTLTEVFTFSDGKNELLEFLQRQH